MSVLRRHRHAPPPRRPRRPRRGRSAHPVRRLRALARDLAHVYDVTLDEALDLLVRALRSGPGR